MSDSKPTSASEPTAGAVAAPFVEAAAFGWASTTTAVGRISGGSARQERVDGGLGDAFDPWDSTTTLITWKLVGGILAVLLVAGFGVDKLFSPPNPTGNGQTETVSGLETDSDPSLAGPATDDISDSFAVASTDGLGTADSGQVWETPTGTWGKADGHAYLVQPNAEGGNRSIAVIDLESGNGFVSATVTKMTPGWGLVFRYKGKFNYWMLQASPKFSTYNLVKMDDGVATGIGSSGLSKQEPGTVVGVRFQGEKLTIVIEGKDVASFKDEAFADTTKVGIVAADEGAKDAQWSAFSAQRLSSKPAKVTKK